MKEILQFFKQAIPTLSEAHIERNLSTERYTAPANEAINNFYGPMSRASEGTRVPPGALNYYVIQAKTRGGFNEPFPAYAQRFNGANLAQALHFPSENAGVVTIGDILGQ